MWTPIQMVPAPLGLRAWFKTDKGFEEQRILCIGIADTGGEHKAVHWIESGLGLVAAESMANFAGANFDTKPPKAA